MALYAMSDLHFAYGFPDKTMEVFGNGWNDYMNRINDNWKNTIKDDDLVLIPGDICWATKLKDTITDFRKIDELPGKKVISRGNHDYWWSTVSKVRNFLKENNFNTIDIIRNDNAAQHGDFVVAGTRGWILPSDSEFHASDRKILDREIIRLKICIETLATIDPTHQKKWVVTMHYPPVVKQNTHTEFNKILMENQVDICLYGHLHALGHRNIYEGYTNNNCCTKYKCVAADFMRFEPFLVE